MACSDQITTQDLENAKKDAEFMAEVSTSRVDGEAGGEIIDTATNRLGDQSDTLVGRLKKLGYEVPIPYEDSIEFTETDNVKTVNEGNFIYAPLPNELPFTTSGVWATDSVKFFPIQGSDEVLAENVLLDDGRTVQEFADESDSYFSQNDANISSLSSQTSSLDTRVTTNEGDIAALQSSQGAGVIGYATQAELFADLDHDEGSIAYVTNDTTITNNGTYRKDGASGSGSWIQSSDDLASQAYQQSLESETYLEKNIRTYDLLNRVRFVDNEIDGPYYAPNLTDRPSLEWSISNNELVFTGVGKSTNPEVFWTGFTYKRDKNTEVIVRMMMDEEYTGGSSAGPGPMIYFGDSDLLGYIYTNSGRIFGFNGNLGGQGTYGQTPQDANSIFVAGEEVELRVVIRIDGTGFAIGKKLSNGYELRLDLTESNLADYGEGNVWIAYNRDTASTMTHFEMNELEVIPEDFDPSTINDDIEDLENRVDILEQTVGEKLLPVSLPDGYAMYQDIPFSVLRGMSTKGFITTLEPTDYMVSTANDIYVNPDTGNDSNTGGESDPLATVAAAMALANITGDSTIYFADAEYSYTDTGTIPAASVNLNLIGDGDCEITVASTESGWVQDGTYTNLYSVNIFDDAPIHCYDKLTLDEYGTPKGLIERSQVDANTTPGSYFISGTAIYVHTYDGRIPDNDFRVIRDLPSFDMANKVFYVENITVRGGNDYTFVAPSSIVATCCVNMCSFSHGVNQGFRWIRNAGSRVILNQCEAAWSKINDGFSYTSAGSGTDVIEIDCLGHHNGLENGTTHNGSTAHTASRVLRINGTYTYNNNKNLADVSSNTQSWNLGVEVGVTYGSSPASSVNINVDTGASSWYDSAIVWGGSQTDFDAGSSSTLYLRNTDTYLKVMDIAGTLVRY